MRAVRKHADLLVLVTWFVVTCAAWIVAYA